MPVTAARRRTVWLGLALLVAVATPMHYRAAIHPANESARLYAALAIVQYGTVALDPVFDRYVPGWRRAGGTPNVDVSYAEGRYVLDKAPGLTLLAVPVVAALDAVGAHPEAPEHFPWVLWLLALLLVGLPSAAAALHMEAALRRAGSPAAALIAPAALLATPWLAYGGLLFGHGLAAALVASGALLILGPPGHQPPDAGAPSPGRRDGLLGGLLLGLAVLTELPVALLVIALLAAAAADVERRRALPWVVLGGLGPALALGAWNAVCFGSPFALSYGFKADPAFAAIHSQGAYGITAPSLERLGGILISPTRGLLHLAPWLAAGLVAAGAAAFDRRLPRAWRVALPAAGLGFPIAISGFVDWTAGASMGPRHLTPVIPLLALAAALALRGRPRATAVVAALIASSALLCAAGAWSFPYFPRRLENPLFELAIPVALDGGAPAALDALLPAPLGILLGVVALIAALGPPIARSLAAAGRPALVAALALALTVTHVGLAALPETQGPKATRTVLIERANALDVLGHEAQARAIRAALRR